jgi:hypothetical protein
MNKLYEFEIWQDDMLVVSGGAQRASDALQEADHYQLMYGQDGPVEIRYFIREESSRKTMMMAT